MAVPEVHGSYNKIVIWIFGGLASFGLVGTGLWFNSMITKVDIIYEHVIQQKQINESTATMSKNNATMILNHMESTQEELGRIARNFQIVNQKLKIQPSEYEIEYRRKRVSSN